MSVSDEVLMAYADGEVDAETRAMVDAALRDDPEIRRRIAEHRALRTTLQGAFSAVLDEPVPQRLLDAVRGNDAGSAGNVVDLGAARRSVGNVTARPRNRLPLAMAASLLIGLALGYLGWHRSGGLTKPGPNGEVLAAVGLADVLSNQLSADRSAGRVAIAGLSFRAKTGNYCRTFSLVGSNASSGLACREGNDWAIKVLAQPAQTVPGSSNFRQAASPDVPAVRMAVEESLDGEPLDQAGEIAARQRGWTDPAKR
jgi:hypothetical protein